MTSSNIDRLAKGFNVLAPRNWQQTIS